MPKGIPKSPDQYGIHRRTWGFEVSLNRAKVRHHARFSSAQWGGEKEALRQAQAWRDDVVRRFPPIERRVRAQMLRKSNKSGMSGVTSMLHPDGSVRYWRAQTRVAPGKVLTAYFSTARYGDLALHMAIFARNEQLELMAGVARLHPAEPGIRSSDRESQSPGPPKRSRAEIIRRNNTSGVTGVQFKRGARGHPGFWLAITVGRNKAFSVKTYGHDEAKALAIEERRKQQSLHGTALPHR